MKILQIIPSKEEDYIRTKTIEGGYNYTSVKAWALVETDGITRVLPMVESGRELWIPSEGYILTTLKRN